jgi:hypothetical protein
MEHSDGWRFVTLATLTRMVLDMHSREHLFPL